MWTRSGQLPQLSAQTLRIKRARSGPLRTPLNAARRCLVNGAVVRAPSCAAPGRASSGPSGAARDAVHLASHAAGRGSARSSARGAIGHRRRDGPLRRGAMHARRCDRRATAERPSSAPAFGVPVAGQSGVVCMAWPLVTDPLMLMVLCRCLSPHPEQSVAGYGQCASSTAAGIQTAGW